MSGEHIDYGVTFFVKSFEMLLFAAQMYEKSHLKRLAIGKWLFVQDK